jgi:hypothetical protein
MADKKLRIHRKLKIDMNSHALYESAVRTSLIPLHVQRSWVDRPAHFEGGETNLFPPNILILKFSGQ